MSSRLACLQLQLLPLGLHHAQLNSPLSLQQTQQSTIGASIIGSWLSNIQNTSISSSLAELPIALQLWDPQSVLFLHDYSSNYLSLATMSVGTVLFLPWPSWAKLGFVRVVDAIVMLADVMAGSWRTSRSYTTIQPESV